MDTNLQNQAGGLAERTPRQYAGQIVFEGGKATPLFTIGAYDMAGAVAKLAGILHDQPARALSIRMEEKPVATDILKPTNGEVIEVTKNFLGRTRPPGSGGGPGYPG